MKYFISTYNAIKLKINNIEKNPKSWKLFKTLLIDLKVKEVHNGIAFKSITERCSLLNGRSSNVTRKIN
jgi:hypothetical protein